MKIMQLSALALTITLGFAACTTTTEEAPEPQVIEIRTEERVVEPAPAKDKLDVQVEPSGSKLNVEVENDKNKINVELGKDDNK